MADTPARSDVRLALTSVEAQVARCLQGTVERVAASVWFAGSGRVCAVSLPAPLDTSPEGACAMRAMRRMQVPPFNRAFQAVRYTFRGGHSGS